MSQLIIAGVIILSESKQTVTVDVARKAELKVVDESQRHFAITSSTSNRFDLAWIAIADNL